MRGSAALLEQPTCARLPLQPLPSAALLLSRHCPDLDLRQYLRQSIPIRRRVRFGDKTSVALRVEPSVG